MRGLTLDVQSVVCSWMHAVLSEQGKHWQMEGYVLQSTQ